MLVYGVSNPEGVDNENSIYITKSDVPDIIKQVDEANLSGKHIPVRIEHKGVDVGKVVSAWEFNGKIECILDINEKILEGSLGSEFVRQGLTKDLSMGYDVNIDNSKNSKMRVKSKKLREISIVKKGYRHGCHIKAKF
jgi:hypothetical protein